MYVLLSYFYLIILKFEQFFVPSENAILDWINIKNNLQSIFSFSSTMSQSNLRFVMLNCADVTRVKVKVFNLHHSAMSNNVGAPGDG